MKSNDTFIEIEEKENVLPIAAIFCLAMGLYLLLILAGLLIRKCLLAHGICMHCNPKLNTTICCNPCASCVHWCDCKMPTADNCLDAICPAKQRINCIEFFVCDWTSVQCCNEGGTYTCGSGDYSCTYEASQCDSINCLCCEISFRNVSAPQDVLA